MKTMKIKIFSVVAGAALLSGLVISPVVLASDLADAQCDCDGPHAADLSKSLAGSGALEISAKSAKLVAKASAADKKDVAIAVVKSAVGVNPSAAVAIVSAVVRESATTAPDVAVAAATLQPKR